MTGAASAADIAIALVALIGGFVVGSIPLVSPAARRAGPGWRFLGVTADLAKGVIPVAIGIVTVAWEVGWIAGIGAVLGAAWLEFRRSHRPDAVPTLAGVAIALAPPAGAASAILGLAVLGLGRLMRRDAGAAALAAATVTYPVLFAVVQPDAARLAGLLGLYLVAALLVVASSRRV